MPSPPAGDPGAVREAARLLVAAENPRINAGRMARTPKGITLLVELAELLQASVNGGGDRVNFPSRHPLAGNGSRRARCRPQPRSAGRRRADPGAIPAHGNAKTINISSLDLFIKSNLQDFQHLADADIAMAADAEATLPLLIDEVKRQLTPDRKRALQERGAKIAEIHQQARERRRWKPPRSGGTRARSAWRDCRAELWVADSERRLVARVVAGFHQRLAGPAVEHRQALSLHRRPGRRGDGLRRARRGRRRARESQARPAVDQHPDRRRSELRARRALDRVPPQDPAADRDAQQPRRITRK